MARAFAQSCFLSGFILPVQQQSNPGRCVRPRCELLFQVFFLGEPRHNAPECLCQDLRACIVTKYVRLRFLFPAMGSRGLRYPFTTHRNSIACGAERASDSRSHLLLHSETRACQWHELSHNPVSSLDSSYQCNNSLTLVVVCAPM